VRGKVSGIGFVLRRRFRPYSYVDLFLRAVKRFGVFVRIQPGVRKACGQAISKVL